VTGAFAASAFQGVRVLDLAVAPPGALAAMHLGEYGAAVTRVERTSHDGALWRYANRAKHVVPAHDAVVAELAANADVVVVDLPASELEAAGLSCAQLRARNSSLIHVWMPPHAPTGETADLPYDELLLWAWTGLAAQQPGATRDRPVASVVPIITYEQGALGACAIGAALVDRATRGTVHSCTISGLHAVNAMNTSIRIEYPGIFRPFGADKGGAGASPQFRMYRCRDGVWLFVCALTPSFFFKLLEALDQMDIMLLPEVDGEFAKFVTPPVQKIANQRFAARVAEQDSAWWAARFDAHGVPYAPVQTRAEWAASETVAANDLLLPIPGADGAVGPGLPAVLSRTPGSLTPSEASTSAGTERAAASEGEEDANEGGRAPLEGMLVVDATKFLAGPFGGLVLQDLGARVVKVDPPGGEDFRTVAAASFSALNRDKDQVSLDLKDPGDRDAFTALVHRADALVENMSRQVADELHLDLDGLRTGNPGLVHCHIDGWGEGPLAGTAGFDPLLQARSGLMVAQGGADHPVIQPMSLHDIGTGTLAAFGTIVAWYARTHLGAGQDVDVALSRTSVAYQGGEFTTAPDLPDPVVGYIDYVGDEPDHCFVEAADGWLAVAATTDDQRAAGREIRADRVAEQTVDVVVAACRAAGVPAIAVLGRDEVYTSEALAELGVWLPVDDDDLGEVLVMRDYSRWEGVPPRTRAHMRAAGRDTETVLQDLAGLRRNESVAESSRPV
jgi:crotonobetainyl-CoA:carnitine CoA-transferase CaiB-like acyl-CoA transferase